MEIVGEGYSKGCCVNTERIDGFMKIDVLWNCIFGRYWVKMDSICNI